MMPISICIPTWERYELLLNSFDKVVKDERVGEVVIVDDCSSDDTYNDVYNAVKWNPKVKLFRNVVNKDCYLNKHEAVSKAENEYVVILDSDNCIGVDFIDRLYIENWDKNTVLAPSFAKPTFDYRAFNGVVVTKENVAMYMRKKMFSTALNTMNFFINKEEYLRCFDDTVDPVTADSIFFNYCWLLAGNRIKIVEGLEYDHKVHTGSHYQLNNHRTGNFYNVVERNIMNLK